MYRSYLIVGLLISLGFLASSCQDKPKDGRTDTYSSGVVKIASDESFSPIIAEEIGIFESDYPQAHIVPIFTDEVNAINLLLKDSVRLAIVTRTFTAKEMAYFQSRQYQPRFIHVATDGLALIVNNSCKDTLITVDQFRKILTGEIKTWRQMGAKTTKGDITLVFDNQNSSTVRYAIDSINHGKPITNPNVRAQKTNKQVIDYVSKTPGAIAVIGVNWLETGNDTTNLTFKKEIKVMSVSSQAVATPDNSYKPYQAYLYTLEYPMSRPIYLLLNDPRNGLSWGFATFMTADKGQRIILKSGLLPETQPVRIVNVNDN